MLEAKSHCSRYLMFFSLLFVGGCGNAANPQKQQTIPVIVEQLIPELMKKNDIPGMAVAVSYNDKDYFFEFGVQDKQSGAPVTQSTLFEVGSISKLFTATLASKSQLQGKLSFERPIEHYMSNLEGTSLGKVPVLHLATHTAGGFPLQLPNNVNTTNELENYYQTWQPKDAIGTQRAYANPSIGLLGMLTAKVNNTDFSTLLTNELLAPVGLTNTYLEVPPEALANYAWGNNKNGQRVRLNSSLLADEAYGIKTSNKDLLQFLKANFADSNSTALIDKAMLDTHASLFDTGMFHQALIWDKFQYPINPCTLKQGNSLEVIFNNVPVKQLNPATQGFKHYALSKTGSTNGFGAYVIVIPHKKLAIAMLANKYYPIGERVKAAYKMVNQVLGQNDDYCE